jgi:hypothetical protein
MPRLPSANATDLEYAALLRQIRFSEYAATCARSHRLQLISSELLRTSRMLVYASLQLRRIRQPAEPPE